MHLKDTQYYRLTQVIYECRLLMEHMMANDAPLEEVLFIRKRIRLLKRRKLGLFLTPRFLFRKRITKRAKKSTTQAVQATPTLKVA